MGKKRVGTYKGKPIIEMDEDEQYLQTKNELLCNRNGTLLTNKKEAISDSITKKMYNLYKKYINVDNGTIIDTNDGAFIEKWSTKCWPERPVPAGYDYLSYGHFDKIAPCFATYYEGDTQNGGTKRKFWILCWTQGCKIATIKFVKQTDGTYKKVDRGTFSNFFFRPTTND